MKKDTRPRNNKGQKHGVWGRYWYRGNLLFKSFFHNNRRVGYSEWCDYYNGKLKEKKYYI